MAVASKVKHYSVKEAATKIGISPGALRQMVREKKVKSRRRGIGVTAPIFIPHDEVRRLVEAYSIGR